MNTVLRAAQAALLSLGLGAALSAAAQVSPAPTTGADGNPAPRKAMKVCQDPNNLPFSNLAGEGIENRIADVLGKALGLPVEYFSFPNRLRFIPNTLRYKLPGEDYRCDIVLNVPQGFEQVSATAPYYRSTYALVYAQGRGLDAVKAPNDLLALPKAQRDKLRIGLYDRTPASEWLAKHGLVDQGMPYPIMQPDPASYPGEIIEKDLSAGKIDAAIVWGPIAGYFAKRSKTPLVVVPMQSEPGVKFDYAMAMGVRYGERDWKAQVEQLLKSEKPAIDAILREYNVPLVEPVVAPTPASGPAR